MSWVEAPSWIFKSMYRCSNSSLAASIRDDRTLGDYNVTSLIVIVASRAGVSTLVASWDSDD